jgi:hypothetical protein
VIRKAFLRENLSQKHAIQIESMSNGTKARELQNGKYALPRLAAQDRKGMNVGQPVRNLCDSLGSQSKGIVIDDGR